MLMRGRPEVRIDGDDGVTLVELLVVMSLLLIVGGVVVSGIVSGLRASERGQRRVEALTDLEVAAERMARDLRFADPVSIATDTQVKVYVLRDDGGSLVQHEVIYTVAGGAITEDRAIYDTADPPSLVDNPPARTMIDQLDAATTGFGFTKKDGSAWLSGTDPVKDLADIQLHLRRELPDQDPIEVETSVFVRNVDDGR